MARPRSSPIAQAVAERAGGGDIVPRVKLVMSRGGDPPGGDSADIPSDGARTTGGKGLHVVAPLEPRASFDDARAYAREVAEALVADAPERFVATASKEARAGKIYIDTLRNGLGATAIAPYSTRARRGAPVATPLRWDELSRIAGGDAYDARTIARRLAALGSDPWEGYADARRRLP